MSLDQPVGAAEGPRSEQRTERAKHELFAPRPGGPAERFAKALGWRHPALTFVVALLAGFLVLLAASTVLALFVVHVLVSGSGLGLAGEEQSFVEELVQERTGSLTTISEVGSTVGGAPLLPIIVGIVAIVCLFMRRWLIAAFAVFVLMAESATYHFTSLLVPRDRPSVNRLEDLPVDASFPSGHTAASVAVYSGLVLLLTARFTSNLTRALAWTVAILLTTYVAFSRMYRGMHHPLDAIGGVLVGIGAILLLVFACRAASAAAERRSRS